MDGSGGCGRQGRCKGSEDVGGAAPARSTGGLVQCLQGLVLYIGIGYSEIGYTEYGAYQIANVAQGWGWGALRAKAVEGVWRECLGYIG